MSDFQLSARQEKLTIVSRITPAALKKIISPIEELLKDKSEDYPDTLPVNEDDKYMLALGLLQKTNFKVGDYKDALHIENKQEIDIRTRLSGRLLNHLSQVIENQLMFSLLSNSDEDTLSFEDMNKGLDNSKVKLDAEKEKLSQMRERVDTMKPQAEGLKDKMLGMKEKLEKIKEKTTPVEEANIEEPLSPSLR